jgi:hypothetical protein
MRNWATRDLKPGDLTTLVQIGQGAAGHDEERVKRLSRRGFVERDASGRIKLTAKGRLASIIKRVFFA